MKSRPPIIELDDVVRVRLADGSVHRAHVSSIMVDPRSFTAVVDGKIAYKSAKYGNTVEMENWRRNREAGTPWRTRDTFAVFGMAAFCVTCFLIVGIVIKNFI
jgi:hypothetical protein